MEKEINKIKVCFVQPRAYYLFNQETNAGKDKVGGAQTQMYYLSTALVDNSNFDVHFLVADFGQAGFEIRKKVKLHNAFNFDHHLLKKTLDLLHTLKTINADIYIFRSADTGVAIAVFYTKYFLAKKIFYMLASDVETNFKQSKQVSGIISALSMSFVYKFADILSVQTSTQYNLFVKNRKRRPDTIIKNIIYLPKQDKNIKKSFTLWVGRLDKIKNPELFIELAKRFPKEKFMMIAPIIRDNMDYGHKIKKIVKQINNIKYIDFVEPDDLNMYYEQAKIYVLTSYTEGFSNTMAGAMANGCPVLSFNVNPDDIFTLHQAGFYSKGEKKLFFKYFKLLINNKDARKQVSENAYVYLKKYHNKQEIIKNFIKLLND